MEIRPVKFELFYMDRRTDAHDEANSRFSQNCGKHLKLKTRKHVLCYKRSFCENDKSSKI